MSGLPITGNIFILYPILLLLKFSVATPTTQNPNSHGKVASWADYSFPDSGHLLPEGRSLGLELLDVGHSEWVYLQVPSSWPCHLLHSLRQGLVKEWLPNQLHVALHCLGCYAIGTEQQVLVFRWWGKGFVHLLWLCPINHIYMLQGTAYKKNKCLSTTDIIPLYSTLLTHLSCVHQHTQGRPGRERPCSQPGWCERGQWPHPPSSWHTPPAPAAGIRLDLAPVNKLATSRTSPVEGCPMTEIWCGEQKKTRFSGPIYFAGVGSVYFAISPREFLSSISPGKMMICYCTVWMWLTCILIIVNLLLHMVL